MLQVQNKLLGFLLYQINCLLNYINKSVSIPFVLSQL